MLEPSASSVLLLQLRSVLLAQSSEHFCCFLLRHRSPSQIITSFTSRLPAPLVILLVQLSGHVLRFDTDTGLQLSVPPYAGRLLTWGTFAALRGGPDQASVLFTSINGGVSYNISTGELAFS